MLGVEALFSTIPQKKRPYGGSTAYNMNFNMYSCKSAIGVSNLGDGKAKVNSKNLKGINIILPFICH